MALSDIEDTLSSLLTSCASVEDNHLCIRQLVGSLKLLHSQELLSFFDRQLSIHGRDFDLNKAMILVDAISYLDSGNFSEIISRLIDSEQSEEVVSKILFHLTSGRLQSDRYVKVVMIGYWNSTSRVCLKIAK